MAVEPTTTPPAQDVLNQEQSREEMPQEEQNGSSPSQLLEPDQGGDMLRNAPTFKDDIPAESAKRHATAADDGAEKPKPPGLVTKVMARLGLTPLLLKFMFKSVSPSSRPACVT